MASLVVSLGLKTALVLATAASLHVTVTPPRPIGSTEVQEYDASDKGEKVFRKTAVVVKHPTRPIQILLWSAAGAELYTAWSSPTDASAITAWTLLGATISVCGGALRVWCYKLLADRFTFELATHAQRAPTAALTLATDSLAPVPPTSTASASGHPFPLVTTGPYAVVRHPSYLGACLAFHGACVLFLAPGSALSLSSGRSPYVKVGQAAAFLLALSPLVSLPRRIRKEERMLHEEFGREWERYARAVRWAMLPGVY